MFIQSYHKLSNEANFICRHSPSFVKRDKKSRLSLGKRRDCFLPAAQGCPAFSTGSPSGGRCRSTAAAADEPAQVRSRIRLWTRAVNAPKASTAPRSGRTAPAPPGHIPLPAPACRTGRRHCGGRRRRPGPYPPSGGPAGPASAPPPAAGSCSGEAVAVAKAHKVGHAHAVVGPQGHGLTGHGAADAP